MHLNIMRRRKIREKKTERQEAMGIKRMQWKTREKDNITNAFTNDSSFSLSSFATFASD